MTMPLLILLGINIVLLMALCFVIFKKVKSTQKSKSSPDSESDQETKSPKNSKLTQHIAALEENLAKTKEIYSSVQSKQKDLRGRNAELNQSLVEQKALYSALQGELRLLKKEKVIFQHKITRLEKERNESYSQQSTSKDALAEAIQHLKKEVQTQRMLIKEYKKTERKDYADTSQVKNYANIDATLSQFTDKANLGESLVKDKLITKQTLLKAKEYQANFGGNIIQYLVANQYLNEDQLASWLTAHPKIPYVPVGGYIISDEVINLVPFDIAQQYWLIPVERIANVLIVVMVDPLNTTAIKAVEEVSGCTVQIYLGLLSEIEAAIKHYYNIPAKEQGPLGENPFFIDTAAYKGAERRQSIRLKSKLNISFAENGHFRKSITNDVSRGGFSLTSEKALSVGSFLTLQINLPKELSPLPIASVVQVVRVSPSENSTFAIGVKTLKISNQELNTIMKYASTHLENDIPQAS